MCSQRFPAPAVCWEAERPVLAGSGRSVRVVGEQHIRLVGIEGTHIHTAGHHKIHAIHQTMEDQKWTEPKHGVDLETVPVLLA